MTLGITVGKFYPFHVGHDYLIRAAKAQVDHLVVLVGYKPTQQVAGHVRAGWIRLMHSDVEVIEALEDIPNASAPWAKRALELLQGRMPDVAFTSEAYGESWAALMGARHVTIDLQRARFPISGTQLRRNLGLHWQMLTPPAKAYFAKRVCVIGAESSGTTTLAQALAQHYQTVWVPEWEDHLATDANRLVICDTNPLATHVWDRGYLGAFNQAIMKIADSRHYELYILTTPDFPFVQNGTREGEPIRQQIHQWFIDVLNQKGKTYLTVEGPHERRMAQAIEQIDPLLHFEPLHER